MFKGHVTYEAGGLWILALGSVLVGNPEASLLPTSYDDSFSFSCILSSLEDASGTICPGLIGLPTQIKHQRQEPQRRLCVSTGPTKESHGNTLSVG